jgi:Lon protease-like protein
VNASVELALFPLKTVLFPGGLLALRIFEPRYLDMIARSLRGDNRFGVVAIRSGSEVGTADAFDVGTSAEIVDWHQESGGMLGIRAVGRETFRIEESTRRPDGLYVGRVTMLEELVTVRLPAAHAPLATLLRNLLAQLPSPTVTSAEYDDAVWVGARLAELLPLAVSEKQSLLEIRDPLARLERIAASLSHEASAV